MKSIVVYSSVSGFTKTLCRVDFGRDRRWLCLGWCGWRRDVVAVWCRLVRQSCAKWWHNPQKAFCWS